MTYSELEKLPTETILELYNNHDCKAVEKGYCDICDIARIRMGGSPQRKRTIEDVLEEWDEQREEEENNV